MYSKLLNIFSDKTMLYKILGGTSKSTMDSKLQNISMYSTLQNIFSNKHMFYPILGAALLYTITKVFLCKKKTIKYKNDSVAFITGCDTGLGFTMALICKKIVSLNVIATCIDVNSRGAMKLKSEGIIVIELDLDSDKSIEQCYNYVNDYLENYQVELKLFINNSAIMIFSEFDWLPMTLINKQFNINLLGPIKLTKLFLNLIFKYKTRIINICSHCSLETLPGLITYGITKTGMLSWTNGLRIELRKYNIDVVAVIPGTFYTQSSIMAHQSDYKTMIVEYVNLKPDNVRQLYGPYVHQYLDYVNFVSNFSLKFDNPLVIKDNLILNNVHSAMVDENPKPLYRCDNQFRYIMYHTLFKLLPASYLKDRIIIYFMQMPKYNFSYLSNT